MNTKFLTSVSALAVGLMMASSAAAQIALADDGSTASATEYEDSFNSDSSTNTDNSVDTDYDDSFNSDSSVETDYEDSFNSETEIEDSYNSEVDTDYEDSFNSETEVEDSYNSDSSTEVEDSYNSDSSVEVEDSYNSDASTEYEDSFNTDNSTTTTNLDVRLVLSNQQLQGSVSGISYNSGGGDGSDQDNLTTGAVSWSGNAHQATAGITTESINTGFGSLNQASTMVSANANVTFGAP